MGQKKFRTPFSCKLIIFDQILDNGKKFNIKAFILELYFSSICSVILKKFRSDLLSCWVVFGLEKLILRKIGDSFLGLISMIGHFDSISELTTKKVVFLIKSRTFFLVIFN